MGIFRKGQIMLINFLSSRTNLTIFQCVLYLMIGYIMGQHFSWIELGIVFILLFGIQFVTRVKAVSDGMIFRQIMVDNKVGANEIIRKMKKDMDEMNNQDLN